MFYFYPFLLFLISPRTQVSATTVAINGCPNLDFTWHMTIQNILPYTMDILDVNFIRENLFEITIHVVGSQTIPLKYLYSLKIIGVDGPKGTIQLYGKNENTYLIDSPTDFISTFQVYGKLEECEWWLPNFQIQFEYLQGDAAQYWSTWVWGTSSFDLSTGCNNYDNQGHSQTDFPGFYWIINLPDECTSKPSSSSSKCSSYIKTTSKSKSSFLFPSSESSFESSKVISSFQSSSNAPSLTTESIKISSYSSIFPPSNDSHLTTSSINSNEHHDTSTTSTYYTSYSTGDSYTSNYTTSKDLETSAVSKYYPSYSSSDAHQSNYISSEGSFYPSSKDDGGISTTSLTSNVTESVTTDQMISNTLVTLNSFYSTILTTKDSNLSSVSKTIVESVPTVTTTSSYSVNIQVNSGIKLIHSLIDICLIFFLSQLL